MPEYNSIARSIPANESPLFSVRSTTNAGFGVFASVDLTPESALLISPRPVAHVVFRPFRREVCARCFAYNCGQSWKIKDSACGVVFCTITCKELWFADHGPLEREALATLEVFVQTRRRKDASKMKLEKGAFGSEVGPDEDEINKVRMTAIQLFASFASSAPT